MGNSRCVLLPIMQLNVVSIEKKINNKKKAQHFVNYVADLPEQRSRKNCEFCNNGKTETNNKRFEKDFRENFVIES